MNLLRYIIHYYGFEYLNLNYDYGRVTKETFPQDFLVFVKQNLEDMFSHY